MFWMLTFSDEAQQDAFVYIYEHYKTLMLRKAAGILHDDRLAEDAVSEAFIRIYNNMRKIDDPAGNRCLGFVMTIVRNASLTLLRRESRQPLPLEEQGERADPFDLEQYVVSAITAEEIQQALGALSEDLRSVFLLKYAYDLPHKRIGQLLGITENTVTVRLHRARRRLADILAKEGYAVEKPCG